MSDDDLEEIRKGRLAQLQEQQNGRASAADSSQEDQRKYSCPSSLWPSLLQQEVEARSSILAQILTPEAADRLGRIRLVKASRATDVESRLIMLAKGGQLRSKVTEDQLKELLAAVAENEDKEGTLGGGIVINRRKVDWEEDDDLLNL